MGLRGRTIFNDTSGIFFITTSLVNHEKIFGFGRTYNNLLRETLEFVLKKYQAELFAYVFMPSHIHLVVAIKEGIRISDLMRDFKKFTSTRIRQQLEKDGKFKVIERLRVYARGKKNQVFKLRMDRFDDLVIETEKMLIIKVDYIHNNPVKARLVHDSTDWKYSSARNYFGLENYFIEVNTDWAITSVKRPAKQPAGK